MQPIRQIVIRIAAGKIHLADPNLRQFPCPTETYNMMIVLYVYLCIVVLCNGVKIGSFIPLYAEPIGPEVQSIIKVTVEYVNSQPEYNVDDLEVML